jgi:diaminohydroxyphosphoribosylaminopyrimidine deaminase/5-amino-6-(5-phosphoribosylamino)uracil reductase
MLRDEQFMRLCLELAGKAKGRTSPNPMVGSVVVGSDGQILGQGYHHRAGSPHAEINALNEAGPRVQGATLYVNLEPCCHSGKTGPCAMRIIESGIKRVVVGMTDPNPLVSGGGIKVLKDAGIEVIEGLLEEECMWLNRFFIKSITKQLPWLTLKLATTLDGKIADRHYSSRWISGPQARQLVHRLRDEYDCVLVGSNTVRFDNPHLGIRDVAGGRDPVRAILDKDLSLDGGLQIFSSAVQGSVRVYCSRQAADSQSEDYASRLSKPIVSPVSLVANDGCMHLDLKEVLSDLRQNGINSVLCEGGSTLAGSLLEAGLVDELIWIVAPKILGDGQAISSVERLRELKLNDALAVEIKNLSVLDGDIVISAVPKK